MSSSAHQDMTERHQRTLARLTELGLALAEQIAEDAQAAEDPEARARMAKAFHTVARTVRQSMALEARLTREPPPKPEPAGGLVIARRITEVRAAVRRVVWHEAEDADAASDLEADLDALIEQEQILVRFCDDDLDDLVARLCLDLELSPDAALRWRDLPDPPSDSDDDEPSPDLPWQSSA